MGLEIFIGLFVLVFIGLGIAVFAYILKAIISSEKFSEKRDKFQWHFDKLLLAYKTKVLKDEIRKRQVTMEDLNNIMNEALGSKKSTKHVLDVIEEEVKGEVKKASPKASGK